MDLARYDANDAYILEELRREYQASDAKGRIRLLKRLHRAAPNMGVPLVVALMALEDPHVEVRQWIARHGESLTSGADPTLSLLATVLEPLGGFQPGEDTLADKLKNDPDPFVRACLRENPEVFNFILADSWKQAFAEATHLERLALMRNPKVHAGLIERVFDCEDNELGVAPNERSELVMAYLTNAEALKPSRGLGTRDWPEKAATFWESGDWHAIERHFSRLWTLIAKWPGDTGDIQSWVYRVVGAPDQTRAEIYRSCDVPGWRLAILESCDEDDTETLALGSADLDAGCCQLAYSKIPRLGDEALLSLLQGDDRGALCGLAVNTSLPLAWLEKVRDRLRELDDPGVAWAEETMKGLERAAAPTEPRELFGHEGRRGHFMDDKMDFIGKRLLALEEETTKGLREIGDAIGGVRMRVRALSAMVIIGALGVVLFLLYR